MSACVCGKPKNHCEPCSTELRSSKERSLTERLRSGFGGLVPPVCDEAANEIERLQRERDDWKGIAETANDNFQKLLKAQSAHEPPADEQIDHAIRRIEECELSMDDSEGLVIMLRELKSWRASQPPSPEHGGRPMTMRECMDAEDGGIPFVGMEPSTEPLTHQEIFSAVLHHANEIRRLTECVPAACSGSTKEESR
jgi:hypothetical protein